MNKIQIKSGSFDPHIPTKIVSTYNNSLPISKKKKKKIKYESLNFKGAGATKVVTRNITEFA